MKKVSIIILLITIFLSNDSESVTIDTETLRFDFEYSDIAQEVIYGTFGSTIQVNGSFTNNSLEQIIMELGNTSPPLTFTTPDFEVGGKSGASFIIENGVDAQDDGIFYSNYSYFYMVNLRDSIGPYVTLDPGEKWIFPWMTIDTSFIAPSGNPLDVVLKSQNPTQWWQLGRIPDANGDLGDEVNYYAKRNLEIRFNSVAPIPEPSTMLLLGSGLLGMVYWRRKKGLKQD